MKPTRSSLEEQVSSPSERKPPHGALTRRLFLGASGSVSALTLLPDLLAHAAWREPLAAPAAPDHAPVLAVHMNRLYLDVTGRDTPYEAPTGSRTEELLGPQGDQDYFRHFLY